jgi:uncharacterized protein (DUF1697 family)
MRESGRVTTYIAFLRAVNVGGRKVEMKRLRECLAAAGLANVRTYIASGNVFVDAPAKSHAKLQQQLEQVMEEEFGFEIPAYVRTVEEVEAALARDSFKGVQVDDNTRLVVLFMGGPFTKPSLPQRSDKGDIEIVDASDGELFVVMRIINGRVPNPGTAFKKQFGVEATARFCHTTAKIVEAAKKT